MTGAETAVAGPMDGTAEKPEGSGDNAQAAADPASVNPLRAFAEGKVQWLRSLRSLTDQQEAVCEFWEQYLAQNRATLAARREPQSDVSEPIQSR